MRDVLGKCISKEKFGFLPNQQITKVFKISQEFLHTIKQRRLNPFVLKVDLVKEFEMVDWSMLRLILIKIGLPYEVTRWITGCIRSANIAILVNGSPLLFFNCSRGLRQGCPLSLLLFVLVIEGLSRLIGEQK